MLNQDEITELANECMQRMNALERDLITRQRNFLNVTSDTEELDRLLDEFYENIPEGQEGEYHLHHHSNNSLVAELNNMTMMEAIDYVLDVKQWPPLSHWVDHQGAQNEDEDVIMAAPAAGVPPPGGEPIIPLNEQAEFVQAIANLLAGIPIDQRELQNIMLFQPPLAPAAAPLRAENHPPP